MKWIKKIGLGALVVMIVASALNAESKPFLVSSYPNPFNATITITYELPVLCKVSLEVYNILGQKVATLADGGDNEAGYHSVIWDASNYSSGIYFYKLSFYTVLDVDFYVLGIHFHELRHTFATFTRRITLLK